MSSTLTELLADERQHLDETNAQFWTDAVLTYWTYEALRDVARRTECLEDVRRYTIVGGQQQYDLPTDMLRINRVVYRQSTGYTYALQLSSLQNLDDVWGTAQEIAGSQPYWCVDDQTEILTSRGFKKREELILKEPVYVVDPESGLGTWAPLQRINVYPSPGTLTRMEGVSHSSLTTKDHRWLVERRTGRERAWRKRFVTTEKLSDDDRIILAAPAGDRPVLGKYEDAFVELVAWSFTEGSFRRGRYEAISQSYTANPEKVDRIRNCLTTLFGGPTHRGQMRSRIEPRWREIELYPGMCQFLVNEAISNHLKEVAPNRVVKPSFVLELSMAQLELFLRTAIDADGHQRGRRATFGQKDPARLDAVEMVCAMLGKATRRVHRNRENPIWLLNIFGVNRLYPKKAAGHERAFKIEEVPHTGTVWCPTTPAGTWVARRRGATFVTGNCAIWGAPGLGTQQLYLYPTPSTTLDDGLRVFYYRLPKKPNLNAPNDPVDIPSGWEDLIPVYVEMVARRKEARDSRWKEAQDIYEARLKEMVDVTRQWHDQMLQFGTETSGYPIWLTQGDGW